ncbi:LRR receptor-like serine/threonine-protein kinase EFR [Gossypium hirsutum]|uniref:LRR receptor-like serine/threonine-protein kinase EFR n=1 Tax=Gossypium hirsutum TaxID=3635 RepID=A0A1U8PA50_GOSHI|nr:LRR receptor-like serine/threonine-protein kinase EFR [Gossypium hirsutum]
MAVLSPHFVVSFSTKTTTNIDTDQSALLALKACIVSDAQKILKTDWSAATSVCNWIGVTCGSRHQRVIALNLSSMLLTGTIPSQIGNLSFLTSLDLMNNSFMAFCRISEIRSDMFEHLPRLQVLSLSLNKLSSEIPMGLFKCKELQVINFEYNRMMGGILPKEIGNLTMLRILRLGGNMFEGNWMVF